MTTRTIRLLATLRDIVGDKVITLPMEDNLPVRTFITMLEESYPPLGDQILDEDGELTGQVHIFINGRNIMWLQNLETVIKTSDELLLVPPVAGG